MRHQQEATENVGQEEARMTEVLDEGGNGLMWTVSDMTDFVTCPERIRLRHNLRRRGELTEPLLIGQLEHVTRHRLMKGLSGVYITSNSKDELISRAYPEIGAAVDSSLEEVFPGDVSRTRRIEEFVDELKSRLSREEDERIHQASYLLRCGVASLDIVRALLPTRTEYAIASQSMSCVGRIDAIFESPATMVPMEYKTCGYQPGMDLSSWKLQVAAYCRLLEEQSGVPVNYGILYLTRTFTKIPVVLTDEMRAMIDDVLTGLADFVKNAGGPCKKASSSCEYCPYSDYCAQWEHEQEPNGSSFEHLARTNTSFSPNVLDVIMNQTGTLSLFNGGARND